MTLPEVAFHLAGWLLLALTVCAYNTRRGAQARRALRRAWRDLWPPLAALLLLGAVHAGCGPSTRYRSSPRQVGDQAPHYETRSPRGVRVLAPVWLVERHPTDLRAALDEIDTVTPEPDPRIDPALRGVPLDVTVVVLDPGPYYAPYSPTLLASGEQRGSTLYVAWRGAPSGVRLPALPHELRHLLTNDPNAGH